MKLHNGVLSVLGAALIVSALAACSSDGSTPDTTATTAGSADTPRATVAFVTHQAPGDTFWDLVRRGAEAAAAKDNIDLQYTHDPDAAGQADLVRSAVDSKVDGIAVTLAYPVVMAPAVKTAIAAEIPVVAVNSGIADWKAIGRIGVFRTGRDDRRRGRGRPPDARGCKEHACA